MEVFTNHYRIDIPDAIIHHYDVAMQPSELERSVRLNMMIIRRLQENVAPDIFMPKAVYDGRKNLYSTRKLPFNDDRDSQTFDVTLTNGGSPTAPAPPEGGRPPKIYKVTLTKVANINLEVLRGFLEGTQAQDETVLTAISALNVVLRMDPISRWPFNMRSFFTDHETRDIGGGIELWRGYFQSVRPGIGRMLVNIDISTGTMYKPGPLLGLCLEFLGRDPRQPQILSQAARFPERERLRLQRFIAGVRITIETAGPQRPRVVSKLTAQGANALQFTNSDGQNLTVSQYFLNKYNRTLQFPGIPCVEVGKQGAWIPLELCTVMPGQIMKKTVPPEKVTDILRFAAKKPHDRLQSIRNGLGVLEYGQSEYIRQFGLHVDEAAGPLSINARILPPPRLRYGANQAVEPKGGTWNMVGKRLYQPTQPIDHWVVVVYENQRFFNQEAAKSMITGLRSACGKIGIPMNENPVVCWENAQGNVHNQLDAIGRRYHREKAVAPKFLVIVLPAGNRELWYHVKHFGDVTLGVTTQCLMADKCKRANEQYFMNVGLKVNTKMGGINTIPDPQSARILTDPSNPTIVMGADVMHPPPGASNRPSYAALVANVDSNTAKYIADCRVQAPRREIIEELGPMAQRMLQMYMDYRKQAEKKSDTAPRRIIFYRDGVSEGQFKEVLEKELDQLKDACQNLGIDPKITFIVVGKRHHVRLFPKPGQPKDRSDNCPAGTVVDTEIVHPTETDFYLQSHAGIQGTSRPSHYNVLLDENNLSADAVQALSFALCHVYARCTRSVSIPAPVYYADLVCGRARVHYDPTSNVDFTDSATADGSQAAAEQLNSFRANFKALHNATRFRMYFS